MQSKWKDPLLNSYNDTIATRRRLIKEKEIDLSHKYGSLEKAACMHKQFGLIYESDHILIREWAPQALRIILFGSFNGWKLESKYSLEKVDNQNGLWELKLSKDTLKEGDLYKLKLFHSSGMDDRIPAFANYVVQDDDTKIFNAKLFNSKYQFKHNAPNINDGVLKIYESHIGMSSEDPKVNSYNSFRTDVLPYIKQQGYNAVQIMGLAEHPYYGSFGYHVSNYFAPSSRFGTPDELKQLIDEAHRLGLLIIADIIHSHAVKNSVEGLAAYDGTQEQFFRPAEKGLHPLWDSLLFDYNKDEVLSFLLSNLRMWIEDYKIDGFRFDGVTSMLYHHHGLNKAFTSYDDYFSPDVDDSSYVYLALANNLIHQLNPSAITIAEEVSGMPLMCEETEKGGVGFNIRMAMGVSDMWFRLLDIPYEEWDMFYMWHELNNKRDDERTISYVECHDQALVGGKTFIFRSIDKDIYFNMAIDKANDVVKNGVSLHKLSRFITALTSDKGFLNFMGNEFGHPEWIDFPREDNDWSYHHARRSWSLAHNDELFYSCLKRFDAFANDFITTSKLHDCNIENVTINNEQKVIGFSRGLYFFLFNFNYNTYNEKDSSYKLINENDNRVYTLKFSSDEKRFGGDGYFPEKSIINYSSNDKNSSLDAPGYTVNVYEIDS